MKYYTSIDEMPIYYWNKIQETGDLMYLIIDNTKPNQFQIEQLRDAYETMQREFFEAFGEEQSYKDQLEEIKQLYLWKIDFHLYGDSAADIYAAAKEKELNERETLKFDTTMAIIQRKLGFYVTAKQMTTKDYFTHIYLISKESKGNG